MNRRGFLKACLATAAAPAVVKASSLMSVTGKLVSQHGEIEVGRPVLAIYNRTDWELIDLIDRRMREAKEVAVMRLGYMLYNEVREPVYGDFGIARI